MVNPIFRSFTNTTNSPTSIPLPTGVQNGDLLLVSLRNDGSTTTPSYPAGWALHETITSGISNFTTSVLISAVYSASLLLNISNTTAVVIWAWEVGTYGLLDTQSWSNQNDSTTTWNPNVTLLDNAAGAVFGLCPGNGNSYSRTITTVSWTNDHNIPSGTEGHYINGISGSITIGATTNGDQVGAFVVGIRAPIIVSGVLPLLGVG